MPTRPTAQRVTPTMRATLALVGAGGVYSTAAGRVGGNLSTLVALLARGLVQAPDVAEASADRAYWRLTPAGHRVTPAGAILAARCDVPEALA